MSNIKLITLNLAIRKYKYQETKLNCNTFMIHSLKVLNYVSKRMNKRFNNRIVDKAVDVKNIRIENDIVKNAFLTL